jgi:YbbR domain-containing protein
VTEPGRVWGLRLLAFAIAVALWFVLSFEKRESRSEKPVQASVTYMRPANTVVLNPTQSVDVILSGSEDAIRRVNPFDVSVQVDLRQAQPGRVSINLTPENVNRPTGLRVESIQPSSIELDLDRLVLRQVPVTAVIVGEPAAGATMGEPEVVPPMVTVSGPESQLARLERLRSGPVSLDGHALSFEETVPVVVPDDIALREVEPSRVTIRVPLRLTRPQDGEDGGGPGRPGRP